MCDIWVKDATKIELYGFVFEINDLIHDKDGYEYKNFTEMKKGIQPLVEEKLKEYNMSQ